MKRTDPHRKGASDVLRGHTVSFSANFAPKEKGFAFFSRPTKAKVMDPSIEKVMDPSIEKVF